MIARETFRPLAQRIGSPQPDHRVDLNAWIPAWEAVSSSRQIPAGGLSGIPCLQINTRLW